MAWAQNLLGFCLFACASQARFSWVLSGGLRAFKPYVVQRFALLEATFFLCFYFIFSRFQKQRFGIFQAAVSQWLAHKTCWGFAFSHARPKHVFHGFCLVACGLSSLTLRKGLPCLRQPFFFVFSRFQNNVSAFFWLRFRMAWALFLCF